MSILNNDVQYNRADSKMFGL